MTISERMAKNRGTSKKIATSLDLLFLVKNNPFFKFLLKFKVNLMCGHWGQQLPQNNIQTCRCFSLHFYNRFVAKIILICVHGVCFSVVVSLK